MGTLKTRLQAMYYMLFYRNFILIAGVKEFKDVDGNPCRRMKVIQRTDYIGDSDEVTCMAGVELCKATRKKQIDNGERVTLTQFNQKAEIITKLEVQLKPKNETDLYNWNQVKKAIEDSDFNML